MRYIFTACMSFVILGTAYAQEKPAYKIYNKSGNESDFGEMVNAAVSADVVLFGELHNNAVSHWMQYEITNTIIQQKGVNVILAAEMFESDDQLMLDEYLNDVISERSFEAQMRLWKNYNTDYKPLMLLAKDNHLKFVASNIPRRYASFVFKHGLDSLSTLSDLAKTYMAPLPIEYSMETPGYDSILVMDTHGQGDSIRMVEAQASKDITMAYFIQQNLVPGATLIHYNGDYHSRIFGGIYYYLKKSNPGLTVITISSAENEDTSLPDNAKGSADFVIIIPKSFTKTY